jgi:hypothetical protein
MGAAARARTLARGGWTAWRMGAAAARDAGSRRGASSAGAGAELGALEQARELAARVSGRA